MKCEKGFALLNVIIGLAVGGMLATVVAATIPMLMQWAPRQANKLSLEADHAFVRYWLTRDANAAETYIPLSAPQYGRFEWSDYSGESMVSYNVTYSYDSGSDSLIRDEAQNGVLQSSLPVARKILNQSDVLFSWSPGTGKLTANITATIEDAPGVGDHSRSAIIITTLRPISEPILSPPGAVAVPPAPPGSETYCMFQDPTIVLGTWQSGDYTALCAADGNYYAVEGEIIGGTKYVTWWGESEIIFPTVDITTLQVRFTGQVSHTQHGVATEFFVKDSGAGFPAVPTSVFTFTEALTDFTHTFYLDELTLSYINALPERRVTLRINTADNPMYTLFADQVMFIASPGEALPAPVTYYVYADPTITYGTLVSGNYTSLQADDADYYVVASERVGGNRVVSWWGESENMSAPETISQIEVQFIGQLTRKNVDVNFYVKDSAAGFPATPSSSVTITATDFDTGHSFYLDATALAYVNSLPERRVTLKVEISTGGSAYTLSTGQIWFIASP